MTLPKRVLVIETAAIPVWEDAAESTDGSWMTPDGSLAKAWKACSIGFRSGE